MLEGSFLYITLIVYTMFCCKYITSVKLKIRDNSVSYITNFIGYILVFGPMIIVYGLRDHVGVDYATYQSYFKYFKTIIVSWFDIFNQHFEPGYILLNKIGFEFINDDYGVFLVTGILLFGLLYRILLQYKNEVSVPFVVYIFFCVYFGSSCNIVRQCIAMLIVANGYNLLLQKKYKQYALVCAIAFMFHKSAAFCFVLIFYDKFYDYVRKNIKRIVIILSFLFVASGQFIMDNVRSLSLFKITYERTGFNASAFLFLLYVIPEIFVMEKFKQCIDLSLRDKYERLICLFYLQIPFQLLDAYSSALQRVGIYFSIVQIVIIPAIIKTFDKSASRYLVRLIVILWYLLFFVMTEIIMVGNGLFPYKFILK